MTMIDTRTPAQRVVEDQEKRRKPVIELLAWMRDGERPIWVTADDLLPVLSRKVGHDVPLIQVERALDALFTRDLYVRSGSSNDRMIGQLEERVTEAVDEILAVVRCGAPPCGEVIPYDATRVACLDGDRVEFCDRHCHVATHGERCEAGTDRVAS